MSSKLETYIIHGVWLGEDFTHDYFLRPDRDELDKLLVINEKPWLIVDGMDAQYSFFGLINKIDTEEIITAYDFVPDKSKQIIKNKWKEYFNDFKIPEIRMYYLNHYI